jgi:hypothetical protein
VSATSQGAAPDERDHDVRSLCHICRDDRVFQVPTLAVGSELRGDKLLEYVQGGLRFLHLPDTGGLSVQKSTFHQYPPPLANAFIEPKLQSRTTTKSAPCREDGRH